MIFKCVICEKEEEFSIQNLRKLHETGKSLSISEIMTVLNEIKGDICVFENRVGKHVFMLTHDENLIKLAGEYQDLENIKDESEKIIKKKDLENRFENIVGHRGMDSWFKYG